MQLYYLWFAVLSKSYQDFQKMTPLLPGFCTFIKLLLLSIFHPKNNNHVAIWANSHIIFSEIVPRVHQYHLILDPSASLVKSVFNLLIKYNKLKLYPYVKKILKKEDKKWCSALHPCRSTPKVVEAPHDLFKGLLVKASTTHSRRASRPSWGVGRGGPATPRAELHLWGVGCGASVTPRGGHASMNVCGGCRGTATSARQGWIYMLVIGVELLSFFL